MRARTIDLNADLGEGAGEEALFALVSSANVACGGHAGDAATMREAVVRALAYDVAVGAHPSYPDRARFGRASVPMEPAALADAVAGQISALVEIAGSLGAAVTHVKPHGALYNDTARDPVVASAIAAGTARVSRALILVGLAGSPALDLWRRQGFAVASEGFADRAYEPDGSLVPRTRPGAVLDEPGAAAAQALALAANGRCDTICVHGDTAGAAGILAAVRRRLEGAGWSIAPFGNRARGT